MCIMDMECEQCKKIIKKNLDTITIINLVQIISVNDISQIHN